MQVLRIWKGYRNAQVGWLQDAERWHGRFERQQQQQQQQQGEGAEGDDSGLRQGQGGGGGDGHATLHAGVAYGLYLVLYSPRRSVLEVRRASVTRLTSAFSALLLAHHSRTLCSLFHFPSR